MTVEVKEANDTWTTIRTDAHFDTLYTHEFYGYTFDWERFLIILWILSFFWERTSAVGQSEAHLRWIVPADTPDGDYRISHFGYYKNIDASIVSYNGTTKSFKVYKLNL